MDQDTSLKDLLESVHTVAIVGLSADEGKPSNLVARYLISKGFRVIPVNPGHDTILGEKSYRSTSDIPNKIDVVDIFMKSERVLPVVEEAIKLKPKAIWLQLGIRNDEAKKLAAGSGIMFVMDRCIKQEHTRLLGTP
jgi:uncharacterized protein